MLDLDTILELFKKYGFSSATVHPYIYRSEEAMGICYSYYDEEYGGLERIKLFDDIDSFEKFLKDLSWVKENGKNYHIKMALDNYETLIPRILYLRNEKVMSDKELSNIADYDYKRSQKYKMDELSHIMAEAGDLLEIYNEIKERQIAFLTKLVVLKNSLRQKYFDLQKEVDIYNKFNVERNLTLYPVVPDNGGIDEAMEITLKDRYNLYKTNQPTIEEANDFLKEIWDLNMRLESNSRYYSALKEENDVRNELKVVNKKLVFMKELNENLKSLFGVDLITEFRKINKECQEESSSIDEAYISSQLDNIGRKYSFYDVLDKFYLTDYLREAVHNTNYKDLAIKYSKNTPKDNLDCIKTQLNEIAVDLTMQYREKLSIDEQSILVLCNNHKYRRMSNAILEIENFETLDIKELIKNISKLKWFSKFKSECYDSVKKRIDDPLNTRIKNSIFLNYNFETFETFMASFVKELAKLKKIDNKMVIKNNIDMYVKVKQADEIKNKKFILATNDLNGLSQEVIEEKSIIGVTLLKSKTPVLYSPYYFDLGDIYTKNASPLMEIKEMINFELLIDLSDINVDVDPIVTSVANYYTEPKLEENISYVDDVKLRSRIDFCKYYVLSKFIKNIDVISENNVELNKAMQQNMDIINQSNLETAKAEQAGEVATPQVVDEKKTEGENKPVNATQPVKPEVKQVSTEKKVEPVAKPITTTEVTKPVTSQTSTEKKTEGENKPVTATQPVKPEVKQVSAEKKVEPSATSK